MKTLTTLLFLVATALGGPIHGISRRASSTTTYTTGSSANDVTNGVCAPLTVIFARGTSEAGNIGSIIGPPLFKALSSDLNKHVALQGVNYPADLAGDLNLGASGSPNLISLVNQAKQNCPSTKIALSGYSQGGLVIHYALNQGGLSSSLVSAIVYFGDPEDGTAPSGSVPANEIKEYCALGDGVCETHSFLITPAHLSYGIDASSAAQFIISTTGASA